MLKQNMPYITVFKLPSGEEFICKVTDESSDHYTVSKPLTIVPTERGMGFAPVLMLADPDQPIIIPKPVISGQPTSKVEEQYMNATSSIIQPKKGGIIT